MHAAIAEKKFIKVGLIKITDIDISYPHLKDKNRLPNTLIDYVVKTLIEYKVEHEINWWSDVGGCVYALQNFFG